MVRVIFAPKMNASDFLHFTLERARHSCNLNNLLYSVMFIQRLKSLEIPTGKRVLGRPRMRWRFSIKSNLQKMNIPFYQKLMEDPVEKKIASYIYVFVRLLMLSIFF